MGWEEGEKTNQVVDRLCAHGVDQVDYELDEEDDEEEGRHRSGK